MVKRMKHRRPYAGQTATQLPSRPGGGNRPVGGRRGRRRVRYIRPALYWLRQAPPVYYLRDTGLDPQLPDPSKATKDQLIRARIMAGCPEGCRVCMGDTLDQCYCTGCSSREAVDTRMRLALYEAIQKQTRCNATCAFECMEEGFQAFYQGQGRLPQYNGDYEWIYRYAATCAAAK